MKPAVYALTCAVVFLPVMLFAESDAAETAPAPSSEAPHQVGLIDMAYVFKNSKRFLSLTEELQQEIEKTDQEAKDKVDRIRKLQTQLKQSRDAEQGSSDPSLENQLLEAKTELESFKRIAQQSFLRKEAEIYKDVYLEVEEAARRYATYYKYTLILRFERQSLETQDDPQAAMNAMNRQIVHHQPQDDITEPILKYLNNKWEKSQKEPLAPEPVSSSRKEPSPEEVSETPQKDVKFRFGGMESTR